MPARNWWCFTFEARREGSIGAFMHLKIQVRSDEESQAFAWALDELETYGYERRNLLAVKRGFEHETKGDQLDAM
jgi:predicted GNAT superfamily acetyltransferase